MNKGNDNMDNGKVAHVLNELIDVCKDGEAGFREAAQGVDNSNLKTLFNKYSSQRGEFARELQNQVVMLGELPEQTGTVRAALHRGWINIKQAVTGKNSKAIIDECEAGEDIAKGTYERVLNDNTLPSHLRTVVERQYTQVKAAHDSVRDLKQQAARA